MSKQDKTKPADYEYLRPAASDTEHAAEMSPKPKKGGETKTKPKKKC